MKKSSKIVLALTIVLLLVAVGVGGYFLIKISNDSNNKMNSLESEINTLKNEKASNTQSKDEINVDKKSEKEIANEAIRKALKDEDWVNENIKNVDFSSFSDNEEIDRMKKYAKSYIFKLSDQNEMPVYIVGYHIFNNGTPHMNVVTYKNGNVVTSKTPLYGEYSSIKINKKLNQVAIMGDIGDSVGNVKLYQVVDTEYSEFGHSTRLERDEEPTYFELYGRSVSKEKFEECLNKMEYIDYEKAMELTDENIDKCVKNN